MESTVLNKRCPFCAELILMEARKCRYCSEMLDAPLPDRTPSPATNTFYSSNPHISKQSVAQGIAQAHKDYKARNIIGIEIFVLASIFGLAKQSWWVFGGVFLALSACLAFRALSIILILGLSLFWGGLAFIIGIGLFSSTPAGVVAGIFIFLASYGIHESSARWMRS